MPNCKYIPTSCRITKFHWRKKYASYIFYLLSRVREKNSIVHVIDRSQSQRCVAIAVKSNVLHLESSSLLPSTCSQVSNLFSLRLILMIRQHLVRQFTRDERRWKKLAISPSSLQSQSHRDHGYRIHHKAILV